MTTQRIQTALWSLFLIYYFAAKYFVGGFTGFSIPYLISVLALVLVTAILPFYLARWITGMLTSPANILISLILPVLLTAAGLSAYFMLFIAPNYPNIQLANIIHRAIEPGIAITLLLLLPHAANRFFADAETPSENEPENPAA